MKKTKAPATCAYNKCAKKATLWYKKRGLCFNHWNIVAQMPENHRDRKLGIVSKKEEKGGESHVR